MARRKPTQPKAPEVCPVCGEDVPRGSVACPECGADHNSGWREDADICNAGDLPDEDFNYDKFVREEFGSPIKPTGITKVWWITAILLFVTLLALYLHAVR